jgi:hypothetical protein
MSRDPKNDVNEIPSLKWKIKKKGLRGERASLIDMPINQFPNEEITLPKRAGLLKMEILCLCVLTGAAVGQEIFIFLSENKDNIFRGVLIYVDWILLIAGILYVLIKVPPSPPPSLCFNHFPFLINQ